MSQSMPKLIAVTILAGVLGLIGASPAAAFGTQSVPTDLKLDDCTITRTNDLDTVWACPGYKGIPVMVRRAQLRSTLSFGLAATTEKAASQLLPLNFSPSDIIEWRLSNKAGSWKPFATIVHYTREGTGDEKAGDVLVVTRIEEGATCQIAYVDTKANPNASTLAEQAADAHGFDFDCKANKPATVGKFAAW
jgi:hypothetical protein